ARRYGLHDRRLPDRASAPSAATRNPHGASLPGGAGRGSPPLAQRIPLSVAPARTCRPTTTISLRCNSAVILSTMTQPEPGAFTGLGTQLRHVLDLMEADIASVLADLGLADYRPRFSPAVRALAAAGPMSIRELARAIAVAHSAASQTVAEMNRRGFVTLVP